MSAILVRYDYYEAGLIRHTMKTNWVASEDDDLFSYHGERGMPYRVPSTMGATTDEILEHVLAGVKQCSDYTVYELPEELGQAIKDAGHEGIELWQWIDSNLGDEASSLKCHQCDEVEIGPDDVNFVNHSDGGGDLAYCDTCYYDGHCNVCEEWHGAEYVTQVTARRHVEFSGIGSNEAQVCEYCIDKHHEDWDIPTWEERDVSKMAVRLGGVRYGADYRATHMQWYMSSDRAERETMAHTHAVDASGYESRILRHRWAMGVLDGLYEADLQTPPLTGYDAAEQAAGNAQISNYTLWRESELIIDYATWRYAERQRTGYRPPGHQHQYIGWNIPHREHIEMRDQHTTGHHVPPVNPETPWFMTEIDPSEMVIRTFTGDIAAAPTVHIRTEDSETRDERHAPE
jgi:hypothetical protein